MKRSQSAAEFMILVGFAVLALTVLLAVFQNIIVETQNQRDNNRANSFINVVTTEINLAKDSAGNYTRTFYLPTNIRGESYSLVINEQLDLVLNHNDRQHVYFFNESVFGTPGFGTNTIRRSCIGNVCWISLNTQEIPEEIENQLCGDEMNGEGSPLSPYQICSLEHLDMIRDNLGAHYVLTDDIDASPTSTWNGGSGWEPIGTSSSPFTGSLEGQGYAISGLIINRPEQNFLGLFGYVNEAKISDLILDSFEVTGNRFIGALAGEITGGGIDNIGIMNSYLDAEGEVGGLAASVIESSTIRTSYFQEGVIIGLHVGGLVMSLENSIIEDSYTATTIESTEQAGGIANEINSGSTITSSYSVSRIIPEDERAGFIYTRDTGSTVNYGYWNTQSSGQSQGIHTGSSTGIIGRTTSQMKQQGNYDFWDFSNTWSIDEGNSYPFLINNRAEPLPGS